MWILFDGITVINYTMNEKNICGQLASFTDYHGI